MGGKGHEIGQQEAADIKRNGGKGSWKGDENGFEEDFGEKKV